MIHFGFNTVMANSFKKGEFKLTMFAGRACIVIKERPMNAHMFKLFDFNKFLRFFCDASNVAII